MYVRTWIMNFSYGDNAVNIQFQTIDFYPRVGEFRGAQRLAATYLGADSPLVVYINKITEVKN